MTVPSLEPVLSRYLFPGDLPAVPLSHFMNGGTLRGLLPPHLYMSKAPVLPRRFSGSNSEVSQLHPLLRHQMPGPRRHRRYSRTIPQGLGSLPPQRTLCDMLLSEISYEWGHGDIFAQEFAHHWQVPGCVSLLPRRPSRRGPLRTLHRSGFPERYPSGVTALTEGDCCR